MIVLTRKTDYALVALAHLAHHAGEEGVSSAREIADRYHIPLPVLMNILKTLNREGLVISVRGARGGYRLARPAAEISLADMIRALEGPVRLVRCSDASGTGGTGFCEQSRSCPVRAPAQAVHRKLEQFLSEVTLEEIAEPPVLAPVLPAEPVFLQTAAGAFME